MKRETLEKANTLAKEIESLKEHYDNVLKPLSDENSKGYKSIILETFSGNFNSKTLKTDLLYVPINVFVEVYLQAVKSKIEKLETEFNNLTD